jgi:hypothetical protein
MDSVSTQNSVAMIYLNHRLFRSPPPGEAGLPYRSIAAWVFILAVAVLILLLCSSPRSAASPLFPRGGSPSAAALAQEQRHLQGFMDALHEEGAVRTMSPCRRFDVCVRVTELFRSLDRSDKRSIGRGVRHYFETKPQGALPVLSVRFLDAETGIELGRYADGRLEWEGRF